MLQELVEQVLTTEKFEPKIKNDEVGYFDRQEKIFIPKRSIPMLVKEIESHPASVLGSDRLNEYYALCQIRTKRAVSKKYQKQHKSPYKAIMFRYLSTEFLKKFANSEINFASLYIDLVGSTLLSMKLPSEKLSVLIDIFTQEMSSLVSINKGYVLKYVGDAVIAFFPETNGAEQMCQNALRCATDMKQMVTDGINSALEGEGFDPLSIRVGIESGKNKIMVVGGTVDIIGKTMNIAAKVTGMAKQNGIAIGQDCYANLDQETKQKFSQMHLDSDWKYKDDSNNSYQVFEFNA